MSYKPKNTVSRETLELEKQKLEQSSTLEARLEARLHNCTGPEAVAIRKRLEQLRAAISENVEALEANATTPKNKLASKGSQTTISASNKDKISSEVHGTDSISNAKSKATTIGWKELAEKSRAEREKAEKERARKAKELEKKHYDDMKKDIESHRHLRNGAVVHDAENDGKLMYENSTLSKIGEDEREAIARKELTKKQMMEEVRRLEEEEEKRRMEYSKAIQTKKQKTPEQRAKELEQERASSWGCLTFKGQDAKTAVVGEKYLSAIEKIEEERSSYLKKNADRPGLLDVVQSRRDEEAENNKILEAIEAEKDQYSKQAVEMRNKIIANRIKNSELSATSTKKGELEIMQKRYGTYNDGIKMVYDGGDIDANASSPAFTDDCFLSKIEKEERKRLNESAKMNHEFAVLSQKEASAQLKNPRLANRFYSIPQASMTEEERERLLTPYSKKVRDEYKQHLEEEKQQKMQAELKATQYKKEIDEDLILKESQKKSEDILDENEIKINSAPRFINPLI